MNEAESRKKEVTAGIFTTKKLKTLPDEAIATSLKAESASALKVDYGLQWVEQWLKSGLGQKVAPNPR